MSEHRTTGRLGSMARRALSIAALVLAGPVVVGMLQATFSSLRHPTGGTCVFNDILYFASGGTGLLVYRAAPWIVMGATAAAIYARWQERPFAISLRWLSAPGFGLVCALLLNPFFAVLSMLKFVKAPYYAFATSPYLPLALPFIVFVMTYRSKWQAKFNDPTWSGVAAVGVVASYVATWALVRPFVLDAFDCGRGG